MRPLCHSHPLKQHILFGLKIFIHSSPLLLESQRFISGMKMNRSNLHRTRRRPARFVDAAAAVRAVSGTGRNTTQRRSAPTVRRRGRRSRYPLSEGVPPVSPAGSLQIPASSASDDVIFVPAPPVFSSGTAAPLASVARSHTVTASEVTPAASGQTSLEAGPPPASLHSSAHGVPRGRTGASFPASATATSTSFPVSGPLDGPQYGQPVNYCDPPSGTRSACTELPETNIHCSIVGWSTQPLNPTGELPQTSGARATLAPGGEFRPSGPRFLSLLP